MSITVKIAERPIIISNSKLCKLIGISAGIIGLIRIMRRGYAPRRPPPQLKNKKKYEIYESLLSNLTTKINMSSTNYYEIKKNYVEREKQKKKHKALSRIMFRLCVNTI